MVPGVAADVRPRDPPPGKGHHYAALKERAALCSPLRESLPLGAARGSKRSWSQRREQTATHPSAV